MPRTRCDQDSHPLGECPLAIAKNDLQTRADAACAPQAHRCPVTYVSAQ